MTFVPNRLTLAFAIAHGQAGSHRFAGRITMINAHLVSVAFPDEKPTSGTDPKRLTCRSSLKGPYVYCAHEQNHQDRWNRGPAEALRNGFSSGR